jgi:hypothetical protein
MKAIIVALSLSSPLLLGGCILAAAGAGAGAGYAVGETKEDSKVDHTESRTTDVDTPRQDQERTPEQPQ